MDNQSTLAAYELNRSDAPAYWHAEMLWTMLAIDTQTAGRYSLLEIFGAQGSGQPPHAHDGEDECLYLVEGEATFIVAGKTIRGASGTFVAIPRQTPHQFRIESETARLLTFYTPAGFENIISGLGVHAQTRALPPATLPPPEPQLTAALTQKYGEKLLEEKEPETIASTDAPSALPYTLTHADAPAFWQVDILWAMLATESQTAGHYSLMEELCPKESGPPPHFHEQDEAFYVIAGEITFVAGEQTLSAKTGSFVSIPAGANHSFRVDSETARILNFYAPAGFEMVVQGLGMPAQTRTLPPKGLPMTADFEQVQTLFQKYGMHPINAPDTLRANPDTRQQPHTPV